MAQGKFSAQVSDWVAKVKARRLAVRNEATERVIEIMQRPRAMGGNMRVDTGFLRASLVVTRDGSLPSKTVRPEGEGLSFAYSPGDVSLAISNADIGDPITAAYTANYARHREYKGDRFVGMAAQQWPQIVNAVCAEAKQRAGA